jgi:hypothetical protein
MTNSHFSFLHGQSHLQSNYYITFTEILIMVYSIEGGCAHSLPSPSSKLAHFALLNDSGHHERRAIGRKQFKQ